MREEDFLQDVTLVGDDNSQIAAHKLVLSACSEILNLPIWANFVDPTDLSLYYLPTTTLRPNQFYKMDSTSSRPSQAALVEAEVEAKA